MTGSALLAHLPESQLDLHRSMPEPCSVGELPRLDSLASAAEDDAQDDALSQALLTYFDY